MKHAPNYAADKKAIKDALKDKNKGKKFKAWPVADQLKFLALWSGIT